MNKIKNNYMMVKHIYKTMEGRKILGKNTPCSNICEFISSCNVDTRIVYHISYIVQTYIFKAIVFVDLVETYPSNLSLLE